MKIFQFAFLLTFLLSCSSDSNVTQNEKRSAKDVYIDTPFIQEYHEGYLVDKDNAAANDIRAIQADRQGNIWIASKNGIYKKPSTPERQESGSINGEAGKHDWQLMVAGKHQGPAYDIKMDNEGYIWVAAWDGVYTNKSGKIEKMTIPKPPLAKIAVAEEGIYALGPHGTWLYDHKNWEKKEFTKARSIRAVISDNEEGLWIGTDVGLYHANDRKTTVYNSNDDLVSAYVTGLDYAADGNLWVGVYGGVTIRNGEKKIDDVLPKDGITNVGVNVVSKSPDGKMWVGTDYGITRFTPGRKDYSVRLSKRWLMSDKVRDITFDLSGNAWIATANGVSAIMRKEMNLAQKADYFYKRLIQRHVREPWIVGRFRLAVPGDTTTIEEDDDDNDGEYTSMYLAMESLRFAVTSNPEAKERARKAFDFLHYLREVTGTDGFFARTIIPASWDKSHDMNRTYTPQELAEELINNPRNKAVETRWHLSKDGKWKWKGDTSSDELCGHLFGYYWYYTLVADEAEKNRVAHHFGQIMDHLLHHDFNLVDVDGKPTKWGVWSPKRLNGDPEWSPEKALNSLEMLSFLKFAYHITREERYQQAYLRLINEEGYIDNAKLLHDTNPAWETYFDIYLALYVYPPLLRYEQDPALKSEYQTHMDKWFMKHKDTKSPFLNFTYNYLAGGAEELDNSIFFLVDAPLDLVDWQIDNGKREDLNVVREPILETLQVDELRPPSEYRTIRWDRNPYTAVGGNPAQERDPVYWLLPYWMGRYLELIADLE